MLNLLHNTFPEIASHILEQERKLGIAIEAMNGAHDQYCNTQMHPDCQGSREICDCELQAALQSIREKPIQ